MGISPRTVAFLRERGHDGLHLIEEGLERSEDSVVIEKARDEERVLLTHDLGFGELMASSRGTSPSIIIFRLKDMRPDRVNQFMEKILADHYASLEQGAVLSVTERQIRVRNLPIK
ncbi:MAG: DUF5615 family PIN-like protein [Dehalococcoidia bacterium]